MYYPSAFPHTPIAIVYQHMIILLYISLRAQAFEKAAPYLKPVAFQAKLEWQFPSYFTTENNNCNSFKEI